MAAVVNGWIENIPIEQIVKTSFEKLGGKLPVWGSHGYDIGKNTENAFKDGTKDTDIERVVIVVPGMLRDPEPRGTVGIYPSVGYGSTATEAVKDEKDKTLVLVPQFLSQYDKNGYVRTDENGVTTEYPPSKGLTPNHFYWHVDEEADPINIAGWKVGDDAQGPAPVSSFALMDEMVKDVIKKFPNLKELVIAGNSAGGQFASRYALVGNAQNIVQEMKNPAKLRFVAANAAHWPYLSNTRLFPVPDNAKNTYNCWPYGFDNPSTYVAHALQTHGKDALIERYFASDLKFLLGKADNKRNTGLTEGGPSQVQGSQRFERGVVYTRHHLQEVADERRIRVNNIQCVPVDSEHSGDKMLKSPQGVAALLGKQIILSPGDEEKGIPSDEQIIEEALKAARLRASFRGQGGAGPGR